MPFFTAWQLSPSPKLQMGFKHPFQPGHGLLSLVSFLVDPFREEHKRRGKKVKEKRKDYNGWLWILWASRDLQIWPSKGLSPSTKSEWSQGRFRSTVYRELELPIGPSVLSRSPLSGMGWTVVLLWRQAAICGMLSTTLLPPCQDDLLRGSSHQSHKWKVDFRSAWDSELKGMSKPQSWGPWWVYLKPYW